MCYNLIMRIKKAYKFRIYPNKEQQSRLTVQFGHTRFVYNYFCHLREQHYKTTGKGLNRYDTIKMLTGLKRLPAFNWLKEADSQILQQSLIDLDRAHINFFAGRAEYPRYKCKRGKQAVRYPQRFWIEDGHVYIPKVGKVRIVIHRPIEGKMKNMTVSKTMSGKYFISIQVEVDIPEPEYRGSEIGIDVGLAHFVTLSTGERIDNPRYLNQAERRLQRQQRKLSHKEKGSRGYEKARLKVARQHEKIANQRLDFLHKLSRQLVDENAFIGLENLNIGGMVRDHNLAKSISDAGWGEFIRQLIYKGKWYGCRIEKADRFFASSRICSECGFKNRDIDLSDREWTCPECGIHHDRDINAAINILEENRVGTTRIDAGGDNVRPILHHVGRAVSGKPEAPQLAAGQFTGYGDRAWIGG